MTFQSKNFLATLTNKPGVYLMLDATNTVLYVGKARHLKKRLASYFTKTITSPKTKALVKQIANVEVTVTHTENEALILENTLIKTHKPRYNILLRDGKSYPYICLSNHKFPRLNIQRGKPKGKCFGPYPHSHAVHETLNLLQKLFNIRRCKDSFFRNRSRPCLQYQIKRCTAPCVDLIGETEYKDNVQQTILFLAGKSQAIIDTLVTKMKMASQQLEFEQAAELRDKIISLRTIQERQYVSSEAGNIDIIAAIIKGKTACVQVLTVRDGKHVGSKAFFPKIPLSEQVTELLAAFLSQYYLNSINDIPKEIIINHTINDLELLSQVISQQQKRQIIIHSKVRDKRARWLKMAVENAHISLLQNQHNQYHERIAALTIALQLETIPQRMECFDVSHTRGEATVASCVVFDNNGFCRNEYRRYNINNITPGDDYAAMQQALSRHYKRATKLPDILFVDGGKGQMKIAREVLQKLDLTIYIVGIAKDPSRKAGLETLILADDSLILGKDSPALHLIQLIRDEAHRFAITSHRNRRDKIRRTSTLEQIEGIGPKRRRQLLIHFGGLQGISKAGVFEIASVPGVSQQLAQKIYDFFQEDTK
ncbi:excinuclease ABC subunit UvrC [Candidatus Halobeggiatoa sp. HSG11]|nr:excinuclease ABC subunit UvrC [Candidatus Halobeggiatoa sp. HSG11]